MNTDTIKGKWQQIKGDLKKTWGKITDDEWEETKGDAQSVSGLIRNKYGQATDDNVSNQVSELFDKHTNDSFNDSSTKNRPSEH